MEDKRFKKNDSGFICKNCGKTESENILSAFECGAHFAHIFTHAPPDAVARDSVAHLGRNGEAEALLLALQVDQYEIP